MRVGSKGRYAVIALVDVAQNSGSGPVALGDVAERQNISLSYLEQLFSMLRRNSLVVSSRGPGGGYRLQRPADAISIGAVFRAVDETDRAADPGAIGSTGVTAALWNALDDHIRDFLEQVTVADVIAGRIATGLSDGHARRGDGALDGGVSGRAELA